MASAERNEHVETAIVGAGQAGLAVAYHLTRRGRACLIFDANERVGDSWRKRWPSLRLYSPACADELPGMRFPGPRWAYPSGGDMADYLESYAARFELPVRTGVRIDAITKDEGRYVLEAGRERITADNVVVATGVFQHDRPVRPPFAGELDRAIVQLHSADYRSPAQLAPGPVLVVGAAHSGADIAYEAARAGHPTVLSGPNTGQFPLNIESPMRRLVFPVLRFAATRLLTVSTPIGRKIRPLIRAHGGPLLRVKTADLEAAGVERVFERTVGVERGLPVLGDGRVVEAANVLWCTGFRNDYSWMRFPLPLDADGYPDQQRGVVAASPGLYFVGLPFLHSFSSMLVLGAGRDGKGVARHIVARAAKERGRGRRRLAEQEAVA